MSPSEEITLFYIKIQLCNETSVPKLYEHFNQINLISENGITNLLQGKRDSLYLFLNYTLFEKIF
ncbi:unnamed protein product [Paramecium sonneborni]|uniref:Uncharacterized protein n=1 Tax=Paramecium sonneborni TaxID=65129 RepID=A0A8S1KLD3_9CILI|nr:unnamed protein product [Paramecium sonneborni]